MLANASKRICPADAGPRPRPSDRPYAPVSSSRAIASIRCRSSGFTSAPVSATPRARGSYSNALEQRALLQFQVAFDQRGAEPAGLHIEPEDTALAQLLEARPARGEQLFRRRPLVSARDPHDGRVA